jgi:HTH-type transcriptional regulator / antitoxin HipB
MRVHTVRDLGALVREAREARHLSQAALAEAAGVARYSVVRLEQGHPRLEAQLVLDVLAAAGVELTATQRTEPAADDTTEVWNDVFADLSVPPEQTPDKGRTDG